MKLKISKRFVGLALSSTLIALSALPVSADELIEEESVVIAEDEATVIMEDEGVILDSQEAEIEDAMIIDEADIETEDCGVTPITIKQISRPNDFLTSIDDDSSYLCHVPAESNTPEYFSFEVKESGYVIVYQAGEGYRLHNISTNPRFTNIIDITRTTLEGKDMYEIFVNAGTYYIEAKGYDYGFHNGNCATDIYISFLPVSKMFTYNLKDVNCSHKTLTVNTNCNMVTTCLYDRKIDNKDAWRPLTGEIAADDIYDITDNGEYTIALHSETAEWKHFNGMYTFTVLDLGNHPGKHEVVTQKASFEKEGKISTTCTACEKELDSRVIPKIDSVSIKKDAIAYTGKNILPSVTIKDVNGKTIGKSHYKLTGGSKKVGPTSAKITMKSSLYEGTYKVNYSVIPKTPAAPTVKSQKRQLIVTAKKTNDDYKGYEYEISTDKGFGYWYTDSKVGSKKTSTKAVFKNLTSKKNYYVRVRTYKTVKGVKYYSAWSKVKKIKVK